MSVISVIPPFPVFTDVDGEPLENGAIYLASVGLNPLILANQIAVYSDSLLTVPIAQPIRTSGGYPVNNSGSAIRLYIGAADYSIVVLDKNGRLVQSSLSNKTKIGLIDLSTDVTGSLPSSSVKYNITAAESNAGVTPLDYAYPAGDEARQSPDPTGIADCSTALHNNDISYDANYFSVPGTYSCAPLSLTNSITGLGWTSEVASLPAVVLVKRSAGTQIAMTGHYSRVARLTLDGNKGAATGSGYQIAARGVTLDHASSLSQQDIGCWVGGVGATGAFNANVWRLDRLSVALSTGDGVYENHTGGTITGTYPAGIPDCNAGLALGCEVLSAGGVGWKVENSIDNVHVGIVTNSCTGKGLVLKQYARGHKFFGVYSEANNGGGGAPGDEVDVESGATENLIIGLRSNQLSGAGLRDVNTAGKNLFIHYDSGVGAWVYRAKFALWNPFQDGSTTTDFEAWCGTTPINAYKMKGLVGGAVGGIWTLETKIDGGALTERLRFNQTGDATFKNQTNGSLWGGKTAFDTTTTGTTIDGTTGRLNIVNSGAGSKTCVAFYDASGAAGNITTNGSGTAAFNTTSDRRLKQNIEDAPDQGARIDAIRIVEFEFKANPAKRIVGVIADELEQVARYAVTGKAGATRMEPVLDEAGEVVGHAELIEPQGVDYSKLVPLLIKEVQMLRARVSALESVR